MNPVQPPVYSYTGENNSYQQGSPPPQMAQPVFVGASMIRGNNPVQCTCPQCGKQIVTQITKKTGILTWLICAGIAFFGGIFGCCLIPFCIDACKDTEHYCPNCHVFLGVSKQL